MEAQGSGASGVAERLQSTTMLAPRPLRNTGRARSGSRGTECPSDASLRPNDYFKASGPGSRIRLQVGLFLFGFIPSLKNDLLGRLAVQRRR